MPSATGSHRALVIGAGMGGLSAALSLASNGLDVTLLEAAADIGGKVRAVAVGDSAIDGGPTVFTMKWVFDELFDEAGLSFDAAVPLAAASLLARHAWDGSGHLDLFADLDASADAIARFSGPGEGRAFRAFAREAATIYALLERPFLRSSKPSMLSMSARLGIDGLTVRPFTRLWRALEGRFADPRLVQLFGRYSTYTGASPYLAPATLMLIAHVEMQGVWLVQGGMKRLAYALRKACETKGVTVRTGAKVERIEVSDGKASGVVMAGGERLGADIIVFNGDASALGSGLLGPEASHAASPVKPAERSLSAIAWTMKAQTQGFPLVHHSVFFGAHYAQEFDAVFNRGMFPADPTVYICAQDRADGGQLPTSDQSPPERLLMVINAPPTGDTPTPTNEDMEQCMQRALSRLSACGLDVSVDQNASVPTGPQGFNRLFPASGGALYGRANHSPFASFARPDNRTALPGLYLAGGSVHPGPGVPMAALSGRLAAARILADLVSTRRSRGTVTVGGTLTA